MVCVSFCVICIVELLVSSVICRFQGLSYLHVPDCIRVLFYFVNSSHYSSYSDFWTLTYYKIYFFYHVLFDMKLLNYLFCDMFGSVLECYELTHISWLSTPGNHAWLNRHCYPIGCVIKSTHHGICSCSPIVNFFKFTFHHGMATSVIFLIKN